MNKFITLLLIAIFPIISCAQSAVTGKSRMQPPIAVTSAPGFTLTASPNPATVQAGGSTVNITVTVKSAGNFSAPVTLQTSDTTVGISYVFTPPTVTPPPNGTVTSTLAITASVIAASATCPAGVLPNITGTSSPLTVRLTPPLCLNILPAGGTQALTITIAGSGGVTSSPSGINCPMTCTFNYPTGTNVTLTEYPGSGVLFQGWGGACTSFALMPTCSFTISSPTTVSASFSSPVTYSARTDGPVFGTKLPSEVMPKETCGASSDSCGFTCIAPACNPACILQAFNPCAPVGEYGYIGDPLIYTGSPTQYPPLPGSVISGTNINGLNSYLTGAGTSMVDPDFNTIIVRLTDASFYNNVVCLGTGGTAGGKFGSAFNMGVSGGANLIAGPDSNGFYRILVNSTSGAQGLVLFSYNFNTDTPTVIPTDICGGYLPGKASATTANFRIYNSLVSDQETSVPYTSITGSFITNEAMTNGNASTVLQAINLDSNFAQFGLVFTSGGACPTTNKIWVGAQSGATMTVPNNPPCGTSKANAQAVTLNATSIYQGTLCDGTADPNCGTNNGWFNLGNATCSNAGNTTNPLCWYIQWKLLFNFSYVPSPIDTVHFVQAQNNCLPQNFASSYTGAFIFSDDDTTATVALGDTDQANHTGNFGSSPISCPGQIGAGTIGNTGTHTCNGPVWGVSYRTGFGCRAFNSMTEQVTGDYGPTGLMTNGTASIINGTITIGSSPFTPGDGLVQVGTGASTQLLCQSGVTQSCPEVTGTGILTGVIWGTPNSSGVWQDCGNNYPTTTCDPTTFITPQGGNFLPIQAPFYYPDVMHDLSQSSDANLSKPSWVQQSNIYPVTVAYNHTLHQTTISTSSGGNYSWTQQFIFSGLAGANDGYLNCTGPNTCPVWTLVSGGNTSTGYTITDTQGGSVDYSNTENASCQPSFKNCPTTMFPNGQAPQSGWWGLPSGGYAGSLAWQLTGLTMNADYQATGHSAAGFNTIYQGKKYSAYSLYNPIIPCVTTGTPGGPLYTGPNAQCPPHMNLNLLVVTINDDQHGSYNNHGLFDFSPVGFTSAYVCNGGANPNNQACPTAFTSLWDSEVVGLENAIARSSPGNPQGQDCQYTQTVTPLPCVYRWGHTFNTDSSWNLAGANGQGNISADGVIYVVSSDWNLLLGCQDFNINPSSVYCWSAWESVLPQQGFNQTATTWSVDGSGNITINMPNQFCPTGGTQTFPTGNGGGSINCGTVPGTATLSGFSETWLNNKVITLGANTANNWHCTANAALPNCTTFIGTVALNVCGTGHGPCSGTEAGGTTQKAIPTTCGTGVPCPRIDDFVYLLQTAHPSIHP